ncbi:hypothetical protein N7510_003193 [Penicillium lagena]|uniref:uncharacterized protein n=1 Tax=Penicillium lagena TaxID=94218 RepID=UPI002541F81B|nr:uncharacterized protein N7510_003193 [Penicillium lagena]KAJ5619209.1 hypothetical protein N7510_003193 [Penicillium lagena]
MRRQPFLTIILLFLQFVGTFAAPAAIQEPQNVDTTATLGTKKRPATATFVTRTSANDVSTITTTDVAATTTTHDAASNSRSSLAIPTTTVPSLDTPMTGDSHLQRGNSNQTYTGGLPIHPQISPAVGIGGILLLFLGGTLAFIGVLEKWIQIFLSAGFISALGVTVLIEYVMVPPVSNAVQGGYLVAIFFTGLIFGGLALIFKEITEGLGCLLGGFCMSMWLLSLKSGGLLSSTIPKIGLVAAVIVGFYALSFTHYTRSYGLIGCTAFSGATAIMLGIDCFSRAGLKEFWLYIWGLNKEIFPRHTYTYPLTRNIRVELAGIIIITAMGVISQLRLWRVIRERRSKADDARKQHEKNKEAAEEEVGRQVEEGNSRERVEWENMYRNSHEGKAPSLSETAVADSRRDSNGFGSTDHEKDAVEMKDMGSTGPSMEPSGSEKFRETSDDSPSVGESSQAWHDQNPEAEAAKHPRALKIVITDAGSNSDDENDSENGAIAGSEADTPHSKRLSGRSLLRRFSRQSSSGAKQPSQSQSEEALVAAEDSYSSVAGIADDQESSSSCPSVSSDILNDPAGECQQHYTMELPDNSAIHEKHPTFHSEYIEEDITVQAKSPDGCSSEETKTMSSASQGKDVPNDESGRLDRTSVQGIPEQTSKVIHSYRTTEWAKHLEEADVPELEHIPVDNEVKESTSDNEEPVAPVDVEQLLQTPFTAQLPQAMTRSMSTDMSNRRSYALSPQPAPELRRTTSNNSMTSGPVSKLRKSVSRASVASRNQSSESLAMSQDNSRTAPTRSRSTPYLTITAPGDGNDMPHSKRLSNSPSLLAVRERMVRNRQSMLSLRQEPRISRSGSSRASLAEPYPLVPPTFSIPEEREDEEGEERGNQPNDEDDVPLSRRRAMLQRQAMHSPSAVSLQSIDPIGSPRSMTPDSGRSVMMAAWRQSVREDLFQRRDPLTFPPPIGSDRPRSLWGSVQQIRDASAAQLGHSIADGMQRGSMTDLHRQAMRRMQATAHQQL